MTATKTVTRAEDALRIRDIPTVVANWLRDQIMAGELLPGSRLREVELAKKFGVSRGPIREALRALTHQGLVVILPRRGAVVWQMSLSDIEEVYELREALETVALRRASARANDDELKSMHRYLVDIDLAIKDKDTAALISADLGFHRAVCRAAGNGRLLAMWEELATQTAVLIGITMTLDESLLRGTRGHHQLVHKALLNRDPEQAARILRDHFAISREKMTAAMASAESINHIAQPGQRTVRALKSRTKKRRPR